MCEWKADYSHGRAVALPDDIATYKELRSVAVDECIVNEIKNLWQHEVQTLGCCCGHGKEVANVIIAEKYNEDQIKFVAKLLKRTGRSWEILQWRKSKKGKKENKGYALETVAMVMNAEEE